MTVSTEVSSSKVIIRYDKKGSSSYTINSQADNEALYNVAAQINSLQTTPLSGVFKSIEEELIAQE